ncbi:hypothetical protein [Enterococcus sp. LJL90]
MTDRDVAIDYIKNFINDDSKHTFLIKGYDDDEKIGTVLAVLNEYYKKGIILCSSLQTVGDLINRAFGKEFFKKPVSTTKNYRLAKMTLGFNSYYRPNKNEYYGNEDYFGVVYPVQIALSSAERFDKMIDRVNQLRTKKIIFVTTSDHSIDTSKLEDKVDDVFIYRVDNDNPDLMAILKRNLNTLPY